MSADDAAAQVLVLVWSLRLLGITVLGALAYTLWELWRERRIQKGE